jgi:hypothetical protein
MPIIRARITVPHKLGPPDRGNGLFTNVLGNQAPPPRRGALALSQLLST